MAVQLFRTPKFRNDAIDIQEEFMNRILQAQLRNSEEGNLSVVYDRDFEDRITAQYLTDIHSIRRYAKIFSSHIWAIGINSTSKSLYTSDAPIVRTGHLKDPSLNIGFASPGVEIVYPLSRNYVLLLYERQYFRSRVKEGQFLQLNDEAVELYNSLQVEQSRRQIYSHKNDFNLAEDMCTENPKLRDLSRRKVIIK